jgi:hypothetical protein
MIELLNCFFPFTIKESILQKSVFFATFCGGPLYGPVSGQPQNPENQGYWFLQ